MKIYLNKNEERRLKAGHLWIFSNEIGRKEGDLHENSVAELYSYNNEFLGIGFYNKNSLIAYRHLSNQKVDINKEFLRERIRTAHEWRVKFKRDDSYRLINSESDFLPGLIIDKFINSYSIQIYCKGMEYFKDDIVEILKNDYKAELIIEKNSSDKRTLEGLSKIEQILHISNDNLLINNIIILDNIKYKIDIMKGQKTGFYLDQTDNRLLLRKYLKKGDKALDVFCNEGGFALSAAYCGAESIKAVDSSSYSIDVARQNAELNNFGNIEFVCEDAFEYLEKEFKTSNRYDVIILDPPSFAKSKKDIDAAIIGYEKLNYLAMKLLKPQGILFTFSCSHHITSDMLRKILMKSALKTGERNIIQLEFHNSSAFHPVHPAMFETEYLKTFVYQIVNKI